MALGPRTAGAAGPGPEAPLLPSGPSLFEMRNRPRRDTPWLVAYLVFLLAALAGGIFAFFHRNTRYGELLRPEALADPTLCPIGTSHAARRLLQQGPDAPPAFDLDLFMKAAGAWLGASAGGAILVGLLFLYLVRVSPGGLVAAAIVLQISVPAAMGGVALSQGAVAPGVVLLVLAGLTVLLFFLWRPQVKLVTQLLGCSGAALGANPGLVPLALGLQVVLLGLVELPLLVAAIGAFMNGTLAYNSQRVDHGAASRPSECVDAQGQEVLCCTWQTERWVGPYLALAGVAMLWSAFLAFQLKLFTTAGATAQWYFAPRLEGGAAGPSYAPLEPPRPRSRVLLSLRHAAGPSLGSLCAGSAVLTMVALVRQALEKARRERDRNLFAACAAACLSLLLGLIEYATRFATVRAALSGEGFFDAGRSVVALLVRNFMDAFGVWWLPPLILQSCSFVLAAAWGVAAALLSYATTWRRQAAEAGHDQAWTSAWLTALVAFLAAWAVLGFLASLLLNIVDALFVCFAMDRDIGQISHAEVHAVLSKLPTVGPVVEQPDGGLAYGAPAPQQQTMWGGGATQGSAARV